MKPKSVVVLREVAVYGLVSVLVWQPVLTYAEVAANTLPTAHNEWVQQGSATRVETVDTMTITTSDRVSLQWNSFDIGRDAAVKFVQPDSSSIALNRVNGGGSAASQIMGSLNANGVIYILDRNGILFGENSKVNVASLVASALDIDPDLEANLMDSNRSIADAVNNLEAAFRVANGALDPGVTIELESGATIRTTEGGQVFLFAPKIETALGSSIHTPGGQTIMAGSRDEVFLAASSDPDLRGMLVEVKTGGSIDHAGEVVAERGNITLAALAVNQAGHLKATTSVNANGTIRLLARDGATVSDNPYAGILNEEKKALAGVLIADGEIEESMRNPSSSASGGRYFAKALNTQQRDDQMAGVVFAAGSVTEIVPDRSTDSKGQIPTAADSAKQAPSFVEAMGHTVDVMGGAAITSTGGVVSVVATATPENPLAATATDTGARITLHDGSRIDVSGADTAQVDMERNSLKVELRGAELADSPVQRNDGAIRGQTAYVDLRYGDSIEFADISGYVANIERSADERLAAGGKVNLASEGVVDFQSGAEVDVSGGTVDFKAGFIRESRLVSNGTYYDISAADRNRDYDALLNPGEYYNAHWNLKRQYVTQDGREQRGRRVEAYTEGKSAGQFNITARAVGYDGTVKADVVTGPYQRTDAERVDGGLISINTSRYNNASQRIQLVSEEKFREHLASQGRQHANAAETLISVDRFRTSADSLSIKTRSDLTLAEDSPLVLDGGGTLALQGRHVQIDADILNHSGDVKLAGKVDRETILGSVTVGADRLIDTSGQWINDLADAGNRGPVRTRGGNITLDAKSSVLVGEDTWLRADGGAWRDLTGRIRGGNGGNVTLSSERLGELADAKVTFAGRATSRSLTQGGRFSWVADGFHIGEGAPVDSNRTLLTPEWFQQGGFSAYDLQARSSGIEVADGTVLALEASRYQLAGQSIVNARSGTALNEVMQVVAPADLPDHLKGAVDLRLLSSESLTPADKRMDDIRIGADAAILARPGARIEMNATGGSINIDGSVIAQGGQINLAIGPKAGESTFDPSQAVRLGADSLLDVSATSVDLPGLPGQIQRDLYDAGQVSIRATAGYILGAEGSRIRANGATRTVSQFDSISRSRRIVPVDLAAGSFALAASEGILMDTSFSAAASGSGRGGSLTVKMTTESRQPANTAFEQLSGFTQFPMTVRLGDYDSLTSPDLLNTANIRQAVSAAGLESGSAYLDVASLNQAAFDSIRLEAVNYQELGTPPSQILFDTDRVLTAARAIELVTPAIRVAGFDAGVSAPYVRIGTDFSGSQQTNAGGLLAPDGAFTAQADFIDLTGSIRFRDAAEVVLDSTGDIRLRGARLEAGDREAPTGSLTAPGDVKLQASQVYAASLTDYQINLPGQGSTLHIIPPTSGNTKPNPVLSAGGTIRAEADHIVQQGVLKAPFGTVNLSGRESITLAPDSVTSVSGEGQTVLLGSVDGLGDWLYPLAPALPLVLDILPEKSIALNSQNIDHQDGALVDISGGGDLLAYYFVKGPTGSRDVLAYGSTGGAGESFAILPTQSSAWAPYDAREMDSFPYQIGDTVRFEGIAGLNAGTEYAILPAHYALLPGALLVTPVAGTYAPGSGRTTLQGAQVVAGQFSHASGTTPGQVWDNFVVEPGSAALERSELRLFSANRFFDANRPVDAGRVVYDAAGASTSRLNIEGKIQALAGAGGTGGRLDINAAHIRLVDQVDPLNSDSVQLQAARLQALNVDSILLGGVRDDRGDATHLTVGAERVEVESGAELEVTELLLAATDTVAVRDGATLKADRAGLTRGGELIVSGNQGALLQASAGEAFNVSRASSQTTGGTLILEQGASIAASGALTLDSTRNTLLGADLNTLGTLSIGANRIVLGSDEAVDNGIALSQATLARLNPSELRLRSRESVDLVADLAFDLNRMILDTPLLQRIGDAEVNASILAADSIVLRNSADRVAGTTGEGLGDLVMAARSILFEGSQDSTTFLAMNGFESVLLQGSDRLRADGRFALDLQGDVTLRTGNLTSVAGSDLAVRADGDLRLLADAAPGNETDASAGFASRYVLAGERVDVDTRISAGSGVIELDARDSLSLGDNAVLDVSGQTFDFAGTLVATEGGAIRLNAADGDISTAQGAVLDLSGGAAGSPGGELILSALNGSVSLGATPLAGDSGGSVAVAVADAGNLQALLPQLQGFRESQRYQANSGDLVIGAADTLRAHQIEIVTNQGSIDLQGTLDASGAEGGDIGLHAGQDVRLAGSARVLARAQGSDGDGGDVTLAARDGGVFLGEGSRFELNGAGEGAGGTLRIDASRSGDAMAIQDSGTQVEGARQVQLAGFSRYEVANGQLNQALVDGAPKAEAAAFMAALAAQRQQPGFVYGSLLQQLGDRLQIVPGVEFYSPDNLVVDAAGIDLAADIDPVSATWPEFGFGGQGELETGDWRYQQGDNYAAGIMRLRAAGDVRLEGSLSDGFIQSDLAGTTFPGFVALQQTPLPYHSWAFEVVAGADAASGKALGVNRAGTGDLLLAENRVLRTGTGDIRIATAGEISLQPDASIYSGGRSPYVDFAFNPAAEVPDSIVPESGVLDPYASFAAFLANTNLGSARIFYPIEGGNVTVSAGGDINVMGDSQPHTDWLFRSADPVSGIFTWGVAYDNFHNGIGALGGGNLDVQAVGSTRNLTLAVPTTAMQIANYQAGMEASALVDVRGGGDIGLRAGGDILGGNYLVGRGDLRVQSGGRIGAVQPNTPGTLANLVALGEGSVTMVARNDIEVSGIPDQHLVSVSCKQADCATGAGSADSDPSAYFLSNVTRDSADLTSLAGNIILKPDGSAHGDDVHRRGTVPLGGLYGALPAQVQLLAAQGGVDVLGRIGIEAHPDSRLDIFARESIRGNAIAQLVMSDAQDYRNYRLTTARAGGSVQDAAVLQGFEQFFGVGLILTAGERENQVRNSAPIFSADAEPVRLVSQQGDLVSVDKGSSTFSIELPRPARIDVGGDIEDVKLYLQNNHADDITLVRAGGDIRSTTFRDANGTVGVVGKEVAPTIGIQGPGTLLVEAGGDIDLGASAGILSWGDLFNQALADTGANIVALAGLGAEPDFAAFAQRYMSGQIPVEQASSFIVATLVNLHLEPEQIRAIIGGGSQTGSTTVPQSAHPEHLKVVLSSSDARALTEGQALFLQLTPAQQLQVASVYYQQAPELRQRVLAYATLQNELTRAGYEDASQSGATGAVAAGDGFGRGFSAIQTLFNPDQLWQGNIGLVSSLVFTKDGGDINLLTPGGGIDVGLPEAVPGITKKANELGVVSVGTGDVMMFADGDVQVNQSRIFALDGDVSIWSSNGDIDAGRGAKTAQGGAAPRVFWSPREHRFVVDFGAVVSGSGIRATSADPEGSVLNLAAPKGAIDAGDAGIGATNVILAAQVVRGADNIDVGGVSIGVPTNTGVNASVMSAGNSVSGAGNDTLSDVAGQAESAAEQNRQVAFLTVEIIGLGD